MPSSTMQSSKEEERTLILDGGLSTQLERHHGVDLSLHPKLWTAGLLATAEGRATLHAAHVAFARAGADIVMSATYQASEPAMPAEALHAGVDVAVRAAREASAALRRPVRAWLSLGPFGASLADGSEYVGAYPAQHASRGALLAFHERRLETLLGAAEAGALGGVAFETIPSADEARALAQLASGSAALAALPCTISLQCRDAANLADGTPLGTLAAELCGLLAGRAQLTGLGCNCVPAKDVAPIVSALVGAAVAQRARGAAPAAPEAEGMARGLGVDCVCACPNAGGCWDAQRRCWEIDCADAAARSFARGDAARWRDEIVGAGMVAMIGGCCNSDVALVAELRAHLRPGKEQAASQ